MVPKAPGCPKMLWLQKGQGSPRLLSPKVETWPLGSQMGMSPTPKVTGSVLTPGWFLAAAGRSGMERRQAVESPWCTQAGHRFVLRASWDTWDTTRLREGLRDPDTAAEDGMGPSFQGWGKILGLENQAAPGSHT